MDPPFLRPPTSFPFVSAGEHGGACCSHSSHEFRRVCGSNLHFITRSQGADRDVFVHAVVYLERGVACSGVYAEILIGTQVCMPRIRAEVCKCFQCCRCNASNGIARDACARICYTRLLSLFSLQWVYYRFNKRAEKPGKATVAAAVPDASSVPASAPTSSGPTSSERSTRRRPAAAH